MGMASLAYLVAGMILGWVSAEILFTFYWRRRIAKADKDLADAMAELQDALGRVSRVYGTKAKTLEMQKHGDFK